MGKTEVHACVCVHMGSCEWCAKSRMSLGVLAYIWKLEISIKRPPQFFSLNCFSCTVNPWGSPAPASTVLGMQHMLSRLAAYVGAGDQSGPHVCVASIYRMNHHLTS